MKQPPENFQEALETRRARKSLFGFFLFLLFSFVAFALMGLAKVTSGH
ncbi:hypothetical protein [Caballeronia sp. GAFFF2]|nr:hypothetical protein [Caballeronia sp. GAFFF2]